jgi:hypothetical protein
MFTFKGLIHVFCECSDFNSVWLELLEGCLWLSCSVFLVASDFQHLQSELPVAVPGLVTFWNHLPIYYCQWASQFAKSWNRLL